MLRVISWRILTKVIETKHAARFVGNNYKLNGPILQISKSNQDLSETTGKGENRDFSKSEDEEKLKVTEPNKKPDTETNEDERLVTKLTNPTVDNERGVPPWLTKVTKCQETPPKGVYTSRYVDWEKCVNFCFVI